MHPVNVLTTKLGIKIVRKRIPTRSRVAFLQCGQTVRWIKMPLGKEVGLGPGHIVLDGDPTPKFSAHVYYSYCDFVRTLHRRKALLVCSSSSSSLVFYAFYF